MQKALSMSPCEIVFTVAGSPVPQGSKIGQMVGTWTTVRGQRALVNPRVLMIDQSDHGSRGKSNALKKWRERVAANARNAMLQDGSGTSVELFGGPCELSCEFVMPRPSSHFTTKCELTRSAPREHAQRPDLSKLIRAVEDGLTGHVYVDDKLITRYGPMSKRWASFGRPGGVIVRVRPL